MTEDRDPMLQAMFSEASPELDGEAFIADVMARSRFTRYRMAVGSLAVAAILVAVAGVVLVPVQELGAILAQGLTMALIDVGEGWWSLIMSPINSVAGLLVLLVKMVRMAMKRVRSASYA